jgi:hypothetical protein
MPGRPNKPPEIEAPPAPPPSATESPKQKALRRLVPSRIALTLPIWKGAPSRDLLDPLTEAERLFDAGDLAGAESALDRLAIRFHEPRWPTLPAPFKDLRVAIPFPQPPQWDPDHAAAPAEREAHRLEKYASLQLALARGALGAVQAKGTDVADLRPALARAETALAADDRGPAFWEPIDELWLGLRARVPAPTSPVRAPAPAAHAEPSVAEP